MGNSVTFQDTKIWRNDITTERGVFRSYTTSISSKNQDGTWTNAYVPIRFSQNAGAPEKISNGTKADLDGFLTPRKRKDGTIEIVLMVMKLNLKDQGAQTLEDISEVDSFEMAVEDIPF